MASSERLAREDLSVLRTSCNTDEAMMRKGAPVARARFYGKLRSDPEFLGQLSGEEPDVSFGDWVDRSVGFAHHEGKTRWRLAYDSGPPHAFLYRPAPGAARILAGAITPSQDSVGRAFPLLAVTTVAAEAPDTMASAPVAGEPFFFESTSTLRDARSAALASLVTGALSTFPLVDSVAIEGASADFDEWVAQSSLVNKLWKDLFPRRRVTDATAVLGALFQAGAEIRSAQANEERRYFRLPLGAGGSAAASLWLHVLARVADPTLVSVAMWTLGGSGSLFVALGREPPVDFLLRLWLTDARAPQAVDGVNMRGDFSGESRLPASVKAVAQSGEASVRDLLAALGDQ